jgi:hypothetical protein
VIKLKNDIVTKTNLYIDDNLYAFPYIDDVKEALEPIERIKIGEYSDSLKKALKFINTHISKQEREEFNFYPKHIKEMYDAMMFDYYYKPFYAALNKLLVKHGGYARDLIEEFMYNKSSLYGITSHWASEYKKDLKMMLSVTQRRISLKNKYHNSKR